MAEFDEVGRTIEAFAAEDATVVIGTVLDPDMQDEVRVTVVATGLNRVAAKQSVRSHDREAPRAPISHVQLVRNGTTGQPEFAMDDAVSAPMPSFGGSLRGSLRSSEPSAAPAVADFPSDSYLDIPAFLRRQAD
jgi:cell division protein FtsZ